MHEKWTDKEIKAITENYKKKTKEELLKMFPNRCSAGIRMKAKRLGLRKG